MERRSQPHMPFAAKNLPVEVIPTWSLRAAPSLFHVCFPVSMARSGVAQLANLTVDEAIAPEEKKFRKTCQALKTSRDTSHSYFSAATTSKMLDKLNRLSKKHLAEAAAQKGKQKRQDRLPTTYQTFRDIGEMLIKTDPLLEKSIQFVLRNNLHEIEEWCVEVLKHCTAGALDNYLPRTRVHGGYLTVKRGVGKCGGIFCT
ncbi:PREDICTED: uncharacterized protein LOC106149482 [Chinchilla lanigera]|uniref:uncharacterized protein LOC106149482 n=1 Tax=Chinchilla lanigera TaxID=34839 RepID=UPI0006962149|nr:PREDICTED: uncharacterized protein LOC106149482 [Chinchilla lanigera]